MLPPVTSQGVRWLLMPSLTPMFSFRVRAKVRGGSGFHTQAGTTPPGWRERPMLLAGVEVGLEAGSPALCCLLLLHWVGIPKKHGRVTFSRGPPHLLMEHVNLLDGCWVGEGGAEGYKILWTQKYLCYENH